MTRDGVRSSWNGQCPIRSAPWRFKSTPRASARGCSEISVSQPALLEPRLSTDMSWSSTYGSAGATVPLLAWPSGTLYPSWCTPYREGLSPQTDRFPDTARMRVEHPLVLRMRSNTYLQAQRIDDGYRVAPSVGVRRITAAPKPYRVALNVAPAGGVIVSPVVVYFVSEYRQPRSAKAHLGYDHSQPPTLSDRGHFL